MAFTSNAQRAESNNQQNDAWKAQGFLNLYLPTKGGKRQKLGAIPLKTAKANEKQLLDWLKEDPTRVANILSKLEIEFRSAEASEGSGFALD